MNKYHRVMEIIWLIAGIAGGIMSVYKLSNDGLKESYMLLIITFIAFLVYFFRRNSRKAIEK